MKKILVVLNGSIFPKHVVTSAINIAKASHAILHAVCMSSSLEEIACDYSFSNDPALTNNNITGDSCDAEDDEFLKINTQLFEDMCRNAGINFIVRSEKQTSLNELIEHSAFSDLILADASENLSEHDIIDLLTDTRCPVYFVSKHVEIVKHIILTYDGSFSSIYAIKQYTLVFPGMKDLPTHLLHITPDEIIDEFPREKNIKSWLPSHYSNVEFKILHGNVRNGLVNFA